MARATAIRWPSEDTTLAMAKFRCPGCDYTYDETLGDAHEGYPAGTPFESLPEEFTCPDCAVRYKEDFQPLAD